MSCKLCEGRASPHSGFCDFHAAERIETLEAKAQAMVEWSYNNFDIDYCEPFDDLRAALLGEQK